MSHVREPPTHAAAPWLHLLLLVALISLLEVGRRMSSTEDILTYSVIARSVYAWLPALAGIALSVAGPRCTRTGLTVCAVVIVLMMLLDVTRSGPSDVGDSIALFPDASIGTTTQASQFASLSWMRTLIEWARGDLSDVGRPSGSIALDDPRARVALAITESGLVLMVVASVGFVIAAMSWVRAHVVFKRPEDARAFYVVLSWLVAPMIVGLTRQFASEQRFRVFFRGAALWRPLVPSIIALAVGVFLWWYTSRYREMEDS